MSDGRAGQYRYVRGRTVDPQTGRPAGGEEIPVSEVVEPGAEILAESALEEPERAAPARRRGRSLGAVQKLEDLPWAVGRRPTQRRLARQKLVWLFSGAVAAIAGMVMLGMQAADPAQEPSPVAALEQPADATTPKARGVAPLAPVRPSPPPEAAEAAKLEIADAKGAGEEGGPRAAGAPPPAAPAPVDLATVRIAINAVPWARIEIDGEPVGETPLAGVELPVGRHRFVAHMPDGTTRERITHVDGGSGPVLFE